MDALLNELKQHIEPEKAAFFPQFFKAFPGGYGEGDQFWGIRVPPLRKLAKKYRQLPLNKVEILITSPIHEQRLLALFILRLQFEKGDTDTQHAIIDFYLTHLAGVNNWDLVDGSAPYLLGTWLLDKDTQLLWTMANSEQLWSQRIAVMSSFAFIKQGRYQLTLDLAAHLLQHPHDLMHKAIGWMLREIGKRDLATELAFLDQHYTNMPRTMLRYAIEKFDEPLRQAYLKGTR
ncbi:DNA alkylation repair protein [Motilimonas cestriensis]|uniref:DNA alkylation repair protein n=1 Tax=Motilimonas cestriensis TaxID=2742685 RepID=A0ABS8WC86_9GAMM|nr:DNA alkylation repair protein [Motilimonas cestriensis]MCE2595937.1 DNA alkylation repair protein [Motilimonas cestriensis]